MITRFVKLHFRTEEVNNFIDLFDVTATRIRATDGCEHVELLQDTANPAIFFTHSSWLSEDHLNAYRNSEFFKNTWTKTKAMFAEKPQAWSLNCIRPLQAGQS